MTKEFIKKMTEYYQRLYPNLPEEGHLLDCKSTASIVAGGRGLLTLYVKNPYHIIESRSYEFTELVSQLMLLMKMEFGSERETARIERETARITLDMLDSAYRLMRCSGCSTLV